MHHTHLLIHTKYLPQNDLPHNQQCLKLYNLGMYSLSYWNNYKQSGVQIHIALQPLQLANTYLDHTFNYSQLYLYNLHTTFFNFRLVQEDEQQALILLHDMAWISISYSLGIEIAEVLKQLQSIASQIGSYIANIKLQL